jgi:hypothetical protein
MINEWIGIDLGETGGGILQSILAFSWRGWWKPQNTSVIIVGVPAEIPTEQVRIVTMWAIFLSTWIKEVHMKFPWVKIAQLIVFVLVWAVCMCIFQGSTT